MSLEEMRKKIEQEDEEMETEIAEKTQTVIDNLAAAIKDWLGDAYDEFGWTYGVQTSHHVFTPYATAKRGIETRVIGASSLRGGISVGNTRAFVDWVEKADTVTENHQYQREKGLRDAFERLTAGEILGHYELRDIRQHAEKFGYIDNPTYAKAGAVYRAMRQVKDKRQKRKDQEEKDRWFALMRNEAQDVETWDQFGTWRSKFEKNVPSVELNEIGDKVRAVLELADAEKEDRAYQAGLEAFHPFIYYSISYVVTDWYEPAARIETRTINSLEIDPDECGFYTTVYGKRIRPTSVFEVEEHVVSEHSQLPSWCPIVEKTEKYDGYQVPPADVKRPRNDQGDLDVIPF